jgi:hypothetical protein
MRNFAVRHDKILADKTHDKARVSGSGSYTIKLKLIENFGNGVHATTHMHYN